MSHATRRPTLHATPLTYTWRQHVHVRATALTSNNAHPRAYPTHLIPTVAPSDTHRVLWIDKFLPEADRDSGSVRTTTLLKVLSAMRCHISIVTTYTSWATFQQSVHYTRVMQSLGIEVLPSWDIVRQGRLLREPFDFIVVARRDVFLRVVNVIHWFRNASNFGPNGYVYSLHPTVPIVFDTVDLHFMRERMERELFQSQPASVVEAIFGKQAAYVHLAQADEEKNLALELGAISMSDIVVVVSEDERVQVQKTLLANGHREHEAVMVISNAHEHQPPTTTLLKYRSGIVFVGNFDHLPNVDAAVFFAKQVMPHLLRDPRVRADPTFVFHIIGGRISAIDKSGPPASIASLNETNFDGERNRVVVHGHVPNLRLLYRRIRLSVAPLRWGAGVKGKINTAHQMGIPVVCTSIAAAGMHAFDGQHALVADEPHAMAAAVLSAYYNETLWMHLRLQGLKLQDDLYSASAAAVGTAAIFQRLQQTNDLMRMKVRHQREGHSRMCADMKASQLELAAAQGCDWYDINHSARAITTSTT